jgi:putative FmdB family regulatory protein
MPLYEYECERCGHVFEAIQKFSDPPIDKCPKCGGPVHKLQSAPAFHLKGSGWYLTDYARKDQSSAPKGEGSEKTPAADKADKDKKEGAGDKSEAAPKTEKPAEKSPAADAPAAAKKD